jgi:methylglutaconyl-CoA hydratase
VHGNALAGGAGLATVCDLVVAHEHARFGFPEVKLGFVPAMVMAMLVRIVGEKAAFELAAMGDTIDAQDALRIDLVNRVASDDDFDDVVAGMARDLTKRSASALRLIKNLQYGIDGMGFEEAIKRGAEVNVIARATDDCRRGVRKFLESKKK